LSQNAGLGRKLTHVDFYKTKGLVKQATFLEDPSQEKITEKPARYGSAWNGLAK
jgi:hypothetical protein